MCIYVAQSYFLGTMRVQQKVQQRVQHGFGDKGNN